MKKYSLMFVLLLSFLLTGCQPETNRDVNECDEGFTLMFGECIEDEEELVCDEGFHVENNECVADTVECEEGFTELEGSCVEIDDRIMVSESNDVYSFLVDTDDTFDMFYHEEITSTVVYVTNVYSAYDMDDMLVGYLYKATGEGRWGAVTYLIALDLDGVIVAFDVIESSENWGAFIELDSFQDQFDMMNITHYLTNDFELGVDGNAAATTTIPLTDAVIKEVATLSENEFN